MSESEPENLLDKRYKTTAVIYFAQIFSSVALIFAAFFFVDSGRAADSNTLMPFWAAIVFAAIAAFVLRRVLTRFERFQNAKLLKGFAGVFSLLQTNSIVLGALAEAIAAAGLIAAFLSGNKYDAARAGAVAFIVFAMNLPRKSVWQKIAASLEKV